LVRDIYRTQRGIFLGAGDHVLGNSSVFDFSSYPFAAVTLCAKGPPAVPKYHSSIWQRPRNCIYTGFSRFFLGDGVLPLNNMAPLTKDTLEVAGSATEVASRPAAQPKAAAPAGHLRADALSLEVPVKVHGSRVSDAQSGAAPRTEPFEEQTSTMIVFPHGCVIRMSTTVNVGQMLVVTNLKTRQDAICRTVKVRTFTNMQSYVEVEFTHKQESYWGVQFSANGPVTAPVAAPQPVAPVASAPASIPAPPAPAASAPVEKPAVFQSPQPVVPLQKPAVVPPPPAAPVQAAPPVVPQVAPPVVPVAPSAPVAGASHVAPLAPPTFVPPPPPPPAPVFVAPVAQAPHVAPPQPPANKQQSPFVWIGTQEDVQPAASSTSTIKSGTPSLLSRPAAPVRQAPIAPSPEIPKIEFPAAEIPKTIDPLEEISALVASSVAPLVAAPEVPTVAPLTMNELRGDVAISAISASVGAAHTTLEELPALEEKPAESSRAVFGSLSGASFGASRTASPEASEDAQTPGKSNNLMLVAVCIGVLFACVAGGVFYFRSQSGASAPNSATRSQATPQSQEVSAEQNALQNSASKSPVSGPVATVIPSGVPAVTVSAGASNATAAAAKTNSPVKQAVSKIASMLNGATPEHPVAAQRTGSSTPDAAPSLDGAPGTEGSNVNALPGVISSANIAAPVAPEVRPEGPVVIGGKVAEPKLIYRAMPVYPLNAKEAGIAGDVVIKTTIDQKGGVVDMHVISGPLMLRQAALDALRRWKFEPSKLDGQPIAVQMQVTIKFSR
jgi:TonB family protein